MAYGYGMGRKYIPAIKQFVTENKIFLMLIVISILLASIPLLIVSVTISILYRLKKRKNILKNDSGESPIVIIATIMIFIILETGLVFVEGAVIDGFLFQIGKLPVTLTPRFQDMMMNSPIMLASIFFSIPSFFGAVLIVWAFKSVIRKHGYTRTGEEYVYEEF